MAAIHDEMLGEPEEAIATYLEVLEMDPASVAALSALDALVRAPADVERAGRERRPSASLAEEEDARIALMLRLGALRETRMGAVEAAIEIYREVLDRDPSSAPALAALERLLQQPEHEVRVAEILEPLYRDAGRGARS